MASSGSGLKVIRVGWLSFEGVGRPYEGWKQHGDGSWQVAGRALTRRGAERKAQAVPSRIAWPEPWWSFHPTDDSAGNEDGNDTRWDTAFREGWRRGVEDSKAAARRAGIAVPSRNQVGAPNVSVEVRSLPASESREER